MTDHKIAVITGTNGYLGIALAERLIIQLPKSTKLTIVITSRTLNGVTDASSKIRKIIEKYPRPGRVNIDYVMFDQLNMVSVFGACYELKKRFKKIDYLFLNSSYSKMIGVDYLAAAYWFFKAPIYAFTTGVFKIQPLSGKSDDDIGSVYQANVLAPWFMINQLIDLLSAAKGRIIWISSSISSPEAFSTDDIELLTTEKSYEGSKYEIELLHTATYKQLLEKHGVQSWLIQPGVFKSTTFVPTLNIFSYIGMYIMFYICRLLGSPYHCIYPEIAANAPVWVALKADPQVNDQSIKYGSSTRMWGEEVLMEQIFNPRKNETETLYNYTENLRQKWEYRLKNQIIERPCDE